MLNEQTETKRTEFLKSRLGMRRIGRDDRRRKMTPNKDILFEGLANIANHTFIRLDRNTLTITAYQNRT